MTTPDIERPDDIPETVAEALESSSDDQLREVIHYAQRLLGEHPPLTDEIESREGEELVRMEDHDSYKYVVMERSDGSDDDGETYAYRVKWETGIDDEGKYRWHYLGKVDTDQGEST